MGKRVGLTYSIRKKPVSYAEALRRFGVEPVLISPDAPIPLDGLDGLLISGGGDVDPARYGEAPHASTDWVDRERDAMEAALIEQALLSDVPLLAICRGLQLLNVVCGGTLHQHVECHLLKNVAEAHLVDVVLDTRLASILGSGTRMVNSRHHQTAERVGNGLQVSARAPDGVIEALEDPSKRFAIAVQWHPEDRFEADRTLFQAFAAALE
jgi:putative glutamine amidotransferase